MDYFTSLKDSVANSWNNRPSWLGGPTPQPQAPMGGRGKTYRRKSKKKSKRRRTGRKSSHL
jgi:hypothetical protein